MTSVRGSPPKLREMCVTSWPRRANSLPSANQIFSTAPPRRGGTGRNAPWTMVILIARTRTQLPPAMQFRIQAAPWTAAARCRFGGRASASAGDRRGSVMEVRRLPRQASETKAAALDCGSSLPLWKASLGERGGSEGNPVMGVPQGFGKPRKQKRQPWTAAARCRFGRRASASAGDRRFPRQASETKAAASCRSPGGEAGQRAYMSPSPSASAILSNLKL